MHYYNYYCRSSVRKNLTKIHTKWRLTFFFYYLQHNLRIYLQKTIQINVVPCRKKKKTNCALFAYIYIDINLFELSFTHTSFASFLFLFFFFVISSLIIVKIYQAVHNFIYVDIYIYMDIYYLLERKVFITYFHIQINYLEKRKLF